MKKLIKEIKIKDNKQTISNQLDGVSKVISSVANEIDDEQRLKEKFPNLMVSKNENEKNQEKKDNSNKNLKEDNQSQKVEFETTWKQEYFKRTR